MVENSVAKKPYRRRRSNGRLSVRVRVPADLVEALGRSEVEKALGTSDAKAADRLQAEVVAQIHREFEAIRVRRDPSRAATLPPPSFDEITRWVTQWKSQALDALRQ